MKWYPKWRREQGDSPSREQSAGDALEFTPETNFTSGDKGGGRGPRTGNTQVNGFWGKMRSERGKHFRKVVGVKGRAFSEVAS